MEVLSKAELAKFVESPDPCKTLKTLVGTRVMFLRRNNPDVSTSRGSKDPWLESDPWKEAAKRNKNEQAPTPVLKLIPEALANANGTPPEVLEKLCHGATGITLITPQILMEWADVPLPMSADELSAKPSSHGVVYPRLKQDKNLSRELLVKTCTSEHVNTASASVFQLRVSVKCPTYRGLLPNCWRRSQPVAR